MASDIAVACQRLGLHRPIQFLRATDGNAVAIPVTWGILRPIVLFPLQSRTWSEDCLRAVLLHELAHVERWDWTTQTAARLACALYWWHPLVWYAAQQSRAEGERACDDRVLDTGMRPSDYAQHLVEVARAILPSTRERTVAIAMAQPSEVSGRVQAVLAHRKRRERVSSGRATGLIALMAACVTLSAAATPMSAQLTNAPSGDLQGQVVVIDPGHGGQDTGAAIAGGVTEKALNLAIAQRLRAALEVRGATVFLTRDGDTFMDIMSRPRLAAADRADYLIGIHCDNMPPKVYGEHGAVVYYHDHGFFDLSLAGSVSGGLGQATGEPGRIASDFTRFPLHGFGVLRGATMPAVLIECGNMANPDDLARLRDPRDQQRIADGIAAGLSAFHTSQHAGHRIKAQPSSQHIPRKLDRDIVEIQERLAQAQADLMVNIFALKSANDALARARMKVSQGAISTEELGTVTADVIYDKWRVANSRVEVVVFWQKLAFVLQVRQRAHQHPSQ